MRIGRHDVAELLVPDTSSDGNPPLHPVLGPMALARSSLWIVSGAVFMVAGPIVALVSGEILVLPVVGGMGLFLVALGVGLRWMLVRRRGLASTPGTRENRVVGTGLGLLGVAAFVAVAVHGVAGGGADEVAVGLGGAALLGAMAVWIARRKA